MARTPCCHHKKHVKKGAWTKDEDERLIRYVKRHGQGSWKTLPKAAGLVRCGKSCRLRWINYLRPNLKRGNFTKEEDELIISLQGFIGNKWSIIASRLPGRTDNEIKNYWNTHIKRRLKERERRGTQSQPKNNIIKVPKIPPSQQFSTQSRDINVTVNPLVNNVWNVARDTTTVNPFVMNNISDVGKTVFVNPFVTNNISNVGQTVVVNPFVMNNISNVGQTVVVNPFLNNTLNVSKTALLNPWVNNMWNVGRNAPAISSSSSSTTHLVYDQEDNKPAEVNLELSLSLPNTNNAVKLTDKFRQQENEGDDQYPRMFGMPSMRHVRNKPVCVCFSLGESLNGNRCKTCECFKY